MSSLSTGKEIPQSSQFSENVVTKGESNPLRMKTRSASKPPVRDVRVQPVAEQVKPSSDPVKVTQSSSVYRTLGVWQPNNLPVTLPMTTGVEPQLEVAKGESHHRRHHARKSIRGRSRSSSSSSSHSREQKCQLETPSVCSPQRSPKCKPRHEKKCSPKKPERCTPPPKPCEPVTPPPPKICTECNPVGNMCAPITIADIYRLYKKSETRKDKILHHFTRQLLASLQCPPSCVGREFWNDFEYYPTVWETKPTESCHCGEKRKECKCIVSSLSVCEDAVSLDVFNFHYPSIESNNGEVTLYPFGAGCVPSPLKICDDARFTIYAVKRHLHKNWCCSKCKSPELCSHSAPKGEDCEIDFDYVIQWAYDTLKCHEKLTEGVRELICHTLKALEGREDRLSDDMHRKYCFVHKELNRDCKNYRCVPPRRRSRSRECKKARSPSKSRSCSRSRSRSSSQSRPRSCSRSRSRSQSRSRSRSRSQCRPRSCSRDRRRSRSQSRSRSRSRSLSSDRSMQCDRKPRNVTPPTSPHPDCKRRSPSRECKRRPSRECKRRHSKECRRRSPTTHTELPECLPTPKCPTPKEKKCQKCHKHKCECVFPVVPESPFAVFHVTGKWVCEAVPCKTSCTPDAQSVKYKIVLDEVNLEHADGGKVCEGWKWFTPRRYKSYFWKMCPQRLPFYPCDVPTDAGCGC